MTKATSKLLILCAALALTAGVNPPKQQPDIRGGFTVYFISDLHYWSPLSYIDPGRLRIQDIWRYIAADPLCAGLIVGGDIAYDADQGDAAAIARTDTVSWLLTGQLADNAIPIPEYPIIGNHEPSRWITAARPDGGPVDTSTKYAADSTLYDFAASKLLDRFGPSGTNTNGNGKTWYTHRLTIDGKDTNVVLVAINNNDEHIQADGDTCYAENNPDGYGYADDSYAGLLYWGSPQRQDMRASFASLKDTDRLIVAGHRAIETIVDVESVCRNPHQGDWIAEVDSLGRKWVYLQGDTHEAFWHETSGRIVIASAHSMREADPDSVANVSPDLWATADSTGAPNVTTSALVDSLGIDCANCFGSLRAVTLVTRMRFSAVGTTLELLLFRNGEAAPVLVATKDIDW